MQTRLPAAALWIGLMLALPVHAAAGNAIDTLYARTCSLCHDGGAGQAPRLADSADWQRRALQGRAVLHQVAIAGKPGSAMGPRGGFAQLSDAEVRALVDYMLERAGANAPSAPAAASRSPAAASPSPAAAGQANSAPSGDDLSLQLATVLRDRLGQAGNAIEHYDHVFTVRGLGIKVRNDQGVITLSGTVSQTEQIEQAQAIAQATPGVRQVINRMLSAALMEWD